ncbi:probable crossover junction endonuclease EME2 isoform X2 [Heteronotia binoei]|uniref:probable crossover junction endonuclease EME2 isoform X2 n=1 Tax=Heteronotia binoei TaxID=13085 RepID=UPI0029319A39|nr:probable crossover junction endonuclease EME2 isoform X2 [Heteronotia binoei]XP_060116457.1 probable crossover junction endonuclease EME2 isoform X2 [Heteronotia binoei]
MADVKVDPLEKTSHVVQRAVTWEISDSEADSDVESWKTTSAAGSHTPAAICNYAGKEKREGTGKSSEGLSLDSVSRKASSSLSLKKRRTKRSLEEMEADRAKLEARKLERELKKEERMMRRKQSALEKQRQKEAAAALKLLRPEQCMKRLTVCVDPGLLEDPGSDALLEALEALECHCCLEPQAQPCTITWRRNVSSDTEEPPEKAEEEREILLLLEPRDFLKRLFSVLQSTSPVSQRATPDLSQLLPSSSPGDCSAKVHDVVVIGLEAFQWYSRHHGEALNPGPEERSSYGRSQPSPELFMTQQQMEEALVKLQLWGNAGVLFLETWTDLAQHVSAVTKAIARRPYKKHLETQPFSFCSTGRWASGVRVREDGTGLREAWCRQIQQFSRASPTVAEAVAREYPSPRLLLQGCCDGRKGTSPCWGNALKSRAPWKGPGVTAATRRGIPENKKDSF